MGWVRKILAVTVVVLWAGSVSAAQITTFGQLGTVNTLTATNDGAGTTTLSATTDVAITNILLGPTDPNAVFEFTATSIDAAQLLGGTVIAQTFEGTFSLHNQADTFEYLGGDFGAALMLGGQGGTGSLFGANTAGLGPLSFTTDLPVILGEPMSFGLTLSNVDPALGIVNGSIGSFTASFAGTADANLTPAEVPEPATMTMVGVGLVSLGGALRRRRLRR